MGCCGRKVPTRGVLVVAAGFLIHCTLGTQLTFGNTNPYFVSYIRKNSSPSDLSYVEGIWVQACMLMGQGVTMFLGGILEHKLGMRFACLLGSWILSAGVLLTYWTLKVNYVTSVLTYGVMFGLGCGIAYPMPVTCSMRWFPDNRGLMSGLIFVGFGLGSTLFNQVITLYLNPDNIQPDLAVGEDVYFTQDEVLDRVPSLFLVLGGTYAAMQLIGVIVMVNPPPDYNAQIQLDILDTAKEQNGTARTGEEEMAEKRIWHTSGEQGDTADKGGLADSSVAVSVGSMPDSLQASDDQRETVDMEVPPLKMLRNKQFYVIWFLFLFGGMGGVFMVSMYKSYGQTFIKDDQFIAIVGSCAAVFNAIGAIVWGYIADRFSFNVAAKILYATFASASFTFVGSQWGMKPYFLIWVCLVLFAISGKFTIIPPLIARMFGNKYMSINYGLLYTSQILTAAASAFMGEMLKDIIHYNGLFFLIGSMSCVGFILTFFVKARTPDGIEI